MTTLTKKQAVEFDAYHAGLVGWLSDGPHAEVLANGRLEVVQFLARLGLIQSDPDQRDLLVLTDAGVAAVYDYFRVPRDRSGRVDPVVCEQVVHEWRRRKKCGSRPRPHFCDVRGIAPSTFNRWLRVY